MDPRNDPDGGVGPTWLRDRPGVAADRQVLVEGVTVAGVALAAVLRRAGYDPVVVGADAPPASRLSILWPPAFDLLDALGAGAAVRAAGTATTTASVWWREGADWSDRLLTGADGAPPVVCRTAALRDALGRSVPGRTVDADRRVAAVDAREDAVVVAFADGVREPFDLVVRTVTGATGTSLRSVEVETARPPRPVDAWGPHTVAQGLPDPGGAGGILRVTTAGADPVSALRSGAWPPSVPTPTPAADVEPDRIAVSQVGRREGAWGAGRLVRCGAAAAPLAPATGLRAALALEDAWVLGDELARDAPVAATVGAYARRRRRRVAALFDRIGDAVGAGDYPPTDATGALSSVATLRAGALGSLASTDLPAAVTDVPLRR